MNTKKFFCSSCGELFSAPYVAYPQPSGLTTIRVACPCPACGNIADVILAHRAAGEHNMTDEQRKKIAAMETLKDDEQIKYAIYSEYVSYSFRGADELNVFCDAGCYNWDSCFESGYYDTFEAAAAAMDPAYVRVDNGILRACRYHIESHIVELVDGDWELVDLYECFEDNSMPQEFSYNGKTWRLSCEDAMYDIGDYYVLIK